jgi:spoIIIJ-associated protein
MSDSREFHGASLEEALTRAAAVLNISESQLDYEVVDGGSTGFLGIGGRDARILVSNAGSSDNWVDSEKVVQEAFAQDTADPSPETDESVPDTATSEELPESDAAVSEPEPLDDAAVPSEDEESGSTEEVSEETLAGIKDYIEELLAAVGFESRVDVYDAGEFVAVDVATEEAGLFIGQKGETIDAFQHLLNVVAYKGRPFGKRLVLDSEGYRQRRIEAIQGMAHRSARRASRELQTVELPPMNASERRIVHVYLKDNNQVTTGSEGSGNERRVTISPAS